MEEDIHTLPLIYVRITYILDLNIDTKRNLVIKWSTFLWHKHLGHISREMIKRLIKNEIISNLDFTNLNICVDCIKGKKKHK